MRIRQEKRSPQLPRQARIVIPNCPHHIVQRGHNRQTVFAADEDYSYYLDNLRDWKRELGCKVYAYCLMTNHVHLLVDPGDDEKNLGLLMKRIGGRQTRYVNKLEKRSGTLWEGRYKSCPVSVVDITVGFDLQALIALVEPIGVLGEYSLSIAGNLYDGSAFTGVNVTKVIDKKPHAFKKARPHHKKYSSKNRNKKRRSHDSAGKDTDDKRERYKKLSEKVRKSLKGHHGELFDSQREKTRETRETRNRSKDH